MLTWDRSRVTAAMWWAWKQIDALEQLGAQVMGEDGDDDSGIYAFKPHYHSTREDNLANWPWSYSVQDAVDLTGPADKAAAIDWKLSPENMRKYTERIRRSGADPNDPRGAKTLRNVFGTLDGRNVYGWNFRDGGQTTSDPSHLWHLHFEITRAFVGSYPAMRELLSILRGETVAQWQAREKRLTAAGLTDAPIWDTDDSGTEQPTEGDWLTMATKAEYEAALDAKLKPLLDVARLNGERIKDAHDAVNANAGRINNALGKLNQIIAAVGALDGADEIAAAVVAELPVNGGGTFTPEQVTEAVKAAFRQGTDGADA